MTINDYIFLTILVWTIYSQAKAVLLGSRYVGEELLNLKAISAILFSETLRRAGPRVALQQFARPLVHRPAPYC